MKLSHRHWLDLSWLLLAALTALGAWFGEAGDTGAMVTAFVALTIAVKGRLVVDHFMELRAANVRLRRLMRLYFYVMPALVLIVGFFDDAVARLTQL